MNYQFAAPPHLMPDNIDYDAAMRIEWRNDGDADWRVAQEHVVGYLMDCLGIAQQVVPGCAEIDGVPVVGKIEVQAVHEKTEQRWALYHFTKDTKYSKPVQCDRDFNPLD